MDDPRAYIRVAGTIRKQIGDGSLKPGQPVPSITAMCKETKYSRRTAGHAMQILEDERLVTRVPGLGYFVAVGDLAGGDV